MTALNRLHADGRFFESPRWYAGLWWVADMFADRVLGLDPAGIVVEEHLLPDHPGGIGRLPDGSLLVVLMSRRQIVRVSGDGSPEVYAELGPLMRGPANDLIVAADGRAWVGGLGFDMETGERPLTSPLVGVTPDGRVEVAAADLTVPNGAVVLGDGKTLVVAETFGSRLTAFPIAADGSLGGAAVWAQLAPPPPLDDLRGTLKALRVAPDGLAVDREDRIWCADAAGGACLLVRAGGEVLDRIEPPPGLRCFACALGGPDGSTLLLCCAPDAIAARRMGARESELLTCQVEVPAP
ncbi:MAG: SMP-30/gluconolactonase/LRE family protein [Actinobacteria bacterium]|nr:SMP-30/gluconolactonase/LRE family protein [Actinomycetota bacterium]